METVGAASAVVGLAIPVFQCAKALRDRIKLVASERAELSAVLVEYEKDTNLLESLYNDNKALLDQHNLDTDLKELAGIIRELDEWLSSINPDLGRKKLPRLKELWRSGDLREKMVASNIRISSIRNRWQTRLHICTLARLDSGQTEMTVMLQQVISMLQHAPVRQRVRTLSMHSQVEPTGFTSETTRVVANVTTSVVSFSILSPDASLSYDRIKLRLDEYRSLLASDSDTIELATENGKTVICRKQANEMEQFVDQAEILLEDVIQSRDISTLVVLHRLRDLSEVLDNLKLYDECRLTGNCALDLAEALGRRSIEFRNEQAETLALIAGLSVYKPRARALFIQAVSTCEEVVENDASYSNKTKLLNVLERAGFWAENHPDLCVQWLGRAVQLMTNELPPTMVTAHIYGIIHYNYGGGLKRLQQYTSSIKAYQNAISIYRMLAEDDPVKYTYDLAHTLTNMGRSLDALGQYDDAIAQYKEAIGLGRAMSAQDPLQCNEIIAKALHNYVQALLCSDRASEAVGPSMEAVSLFRDLAERGIDFSKGLAMCLQRYGECCNRLGRHADAVSAYQESIPIRRAQAARDPKESIFLMVAIHDMAHSLYALSRNDEADAAANEALQMDNGMVLDIYLDAPNFKSCLVCQRIITYDPSILDAGPSSPVPAIPPKVSHGRKRDKIFNLFRKNRAQ